ncbi:hypothetical protein [Chitinophaga defluvii]|uniref:Uncharacterized protein n=1 Tax=Chitinophaga defluvii TaxID=3163343 RepID=A0ABV2T1E5_9BACT
MNIPDKLLIRRMEDYHTHHMGRASNGQLFWGYETFVYLVPPEERQEQNWLQYRLDYAIMHFFGQDGNYLSSRSYCGGTADKCKVDFEEILDEWVSELGEVEYNDIEVKLFQTEIDGHIFGLIQDEEYDAISLEPSSLISFMEPWDGEYYT